MAKNKQRQRKKDILQNKRFLKYLIKKHERLTMILDDNISKQADPIEDDILLLREEWDAFDNSSLPWASYEGNPDEIVTQGELYTDTTSD